MCYRHKIMRVLDDRSRGIMALAIDDYETSGKLPAFHDGRLAGCWIGIKAELDAAMRRRAGGRDMVQDETFGTEYLDEEAGADRLEQVADKLQAICMQLADILQTICKQSACNLQTECENSTQDTTGSNINNINNNNNNKEIDRKIDREKEYNNNQSIYPSIYPSNQTFLPSFLPSGEEEKQGTGFLADGADTEIVLAQQEVLSAAEYCGMELTPLVYDSLIALYADCRCGKTARERAEVVIDALKKAATRVDKKSAIVNYARKIVESKNTGDGQSCRNPQQKAARPGEAGVSGLMIDGKKATSGQRERQKTEAFLKIQHDHWQKYTALLLAGKQAEADEFASTTPEQKAKELGIKIYVDEEG